MNSKAQYTERQHYVPQFYLRRFTGGESNLRVFDLQEDETFPQTPKNAAVEKEFYEVTGLKPNEIEDRLSELEDMFSRLLAEVLSNVQRTLLYRHPSLHEVVSADVRPEWAYFVLQQYFRTPAARKRWIRHESEFEEEHPEIAKYLPESEAADRHSEWLLNPKTYERPVRKWSQFHFSIAIAPSGATFWTSDNPVAVTFGQDAGNGLGTGLPHVALPLSPSRLLEMRDPASMTGIPVPVFGMTSESVRWYNQLQVANAHRFVYSEHDDFADARGLLRCNPEVADGVVQLERRGQECRTPQFEIVP